MTEFWMLVSLGVGLGVIESVAIRLIYNRMKRMKLPRRRCPGCGRWRYEAYHSIKYQVSTFECRKCGMLWMDTPEVRRSQS